MAYIGTSPSNGVRRVHTYTATAGQEIFTGSSTEGVTLTYADTNYIDVFQNGVLLGSADYTSTSGTSVVLAQGASVSDLVVIVVYDVFSVADTVSKTSGGTFDGGITMGGTLGVTGALSAKGGAVFNEDSADVDFRVETDGNANTLFIEGSSNNMSIGFGTPTIASGNGVHLADDYFIGFGQGNGTRPDFQIGQDSSNNTLAFRCGTGADTADLSINTSGLFSGDFNDTSDERLKENIQNIADNQINIVKQLRPVMFDWKEEGKGSDTGFIAQEVKLLLPNDVHTATGQDDDSQLGINSLGLIATLTKALQEAITKIETLEAKVTALENGE